MSKSPIPLTLVISLRLIARACNLEWVKVGQNEDRPVNPY